MGPMIMGGIAANSVVVVLDAAPLDIIDLWATKAELSVDAAKTVKSVMSGNRMTIVEFGNLNTTNSNNQILCLKKVGKTTMSLTPNVLSFLGVATTSCREQ